MDVNVNVTNSWTTDGQSLGRLDKDMDTALEGN